MKVTFLTKCNFFLCPGVIKFSQRKSLYYYLKGANKMSNRIVLNGISYHGQGSIAEIVAEAKARGFKKACVCATPDLIRFGVTAKITDMLDKEGLAYAVFSDIESNPTITNVQDGVAAFKKEGADYIIAIGGGSAMDTAKAVGIIINNPGFADVRSLEGTAAT